MLVGRFRAVARRCGVLDFNGLGCQVLYRLTLFFYTLLFSKKLFIIKICLELQSCSLGQVGFVWI